MICVGEGGMVSRGVCVRGVALYERGEEGGRKDANAFFWGGGGSWMRLGTHIQGRERGKEKKSTISIQAPHASCFVSLFLQIIVIIIIDHYIIINY